jgi:hypothetical protein
VLFGPYVDKTDGVTAEVGLAAAATEISKAGAAFGAGPTLGTHDSDGWYPISLTTTHTNTLGDLSIKGVDDATHLPVWTFFTVLPANAYDALVSGSGVGIRADVQGWLGSAPAAVTVAGVPEVDVTHWIGTAAATPTVAGVPEVDTTHWNGTAVSTPATAGIPEVNLKNIVNVAVSTTTAQLGVNVVQISTDAVAADNLEQAFDDTAGAAAWTGVIDQGTAQSATGTTLVLRAAAAFIADELIGATILIVSATAGAGQTRVITDYGSVADTATVDTWTTTPTGTIVYKVFATASLPTGLPTPVNLTQILGTAVSTPATAGILDVNVKNIDNDAASASGVVTFPAATLASTTNITAGTITTATNVTTVNGLAANVITATAIAADAITDAKVAADVTIASVTGAVGSVTAAVTVGTINANVITATSINADAITAAKVAADVTAEIADGVWDEAIAGHLGAGSTGEKLNAAGAAGDPWITALPGAYGAGTAGKIVGDNLNAPVATVDTVVDAIKAKTDSLTFTVANQVDGNIQSVNDVTVTGTGAPADEWGP